MSHDNLYLGPYLLGPNDTPENGIYTGDARELALAIPDESVDLIFTDPPYPKKYLYLFEWLFPFAARVLKPDGFLLTYTGGYWKDDIMAMARQHLSFFWDYVAWERGDSAIIFPRKTISRYKSILAYRLKDSVALPQTNVLGLYKSGGKDKQYHPWGQDEATTRYYMGCFKGPGSIIVDPFCGGGTTPVIAKLLRQPFLALEIDADVSVVARDRVATQSRQMRPPLFVLAPEQLPLDC